MKKKDNKLYEVFSVNKNDRVLPVNGLLFSDDGFEVVSPSTKLNVFKYMNEITQKTKIFILRISPRPRRKHYSHETAATSKLKPLWTNIGRSCSKNTNRTHIITLPNPTSLIEI